MVAFLSSFSNGAGSAAFSARVVGHTEDVKATISIHVSAIFQNQFSWGAMAVLRTWKYSVREIPGAPTPTAGLVVQILGGPTFGTLSIDSYKSWSAILTDMQLERFHRPDNLIFGHLTFLMQP